MTLSSQNQCKSYESWKNETINHHCTIPLSQFKKSSSQHNPKTSVDNMKNETTNHHCTTKDISSAHDRHIEKQENGSSRRPPRGGGQDPRCEERELREGEEDKGRECSSAMRNRPDAPVWGSAMKAGEPDPHTYPAPAMARGAGT